jgi:hypothetical protein
VEAQSNTNRGPNAFANQLNVKFYQKFFPNLAVSRDNTIWNLGSFFYNFQKTGSP